MAIVVVGVWIIVQARVLARRCRHGGGTMRDRGLYGDCSFWCNGGALLLLTVFFNCAAGTEELNAQPKCFRVWQAQQVQLLDIFE